MASGTGAARGFGADRRAAAENAVKNAASQTGAAIADFFLKAKR